MSRGTKGTQKGEDRHHRGKAKRIKMISFNKKMWAMKVEAPRRHQRKEARRRGGIGSEGEEKGEEKEGESSGGRRRKRKEEKEKEGGRG